MDKATLRSGNLIANGTRACGLICIMVIIGGCGAFSGAVIGAAVSGILAGESLRSLLEPENWPFADNPKALKLECDGEQIAIEVSPEKALVTLSDDTVELERDYTTAKELRYFRMTRLPQDEHELIVNETSQEDFKTDWLVLHSEGVAELKYEGVSISCWIGRLEATSDGKNT